jgi:hypothetical protein
MIQLMELLIVVALGLIPAFFSLLMMHKAEVQARERLRSAMNSAANRSLRRLNSSFSSDHHYVEGVGYLVGDLTCRFNARSAYLRCAVNPAGPCKDCPYYESIELRDSTKFQR